MKKIVLFLLFFVSYIPSNAQIISDSMLIEGHYRVFHFSKPAQSLRRPSLIFVLHGSGGNGRGMMNSTQKMEQEAVTQNALIVYPDGYEKFWNECRKSSPAQANKENINEQAFFSELIGYFKKRHQINGTRVFAVGTSGGGHMVYKLGLTMPTTFKAITAIIANLPDSTNMDCALSGKPIAIMIINGTDDPVNPYNGGEVNLGKNMNMGVVQSTDQTLAYWAGLARYQGKPAQQSLPDTDPNDGKRIERYTYQAEGKPEVVLLKVTGGRHDYPSDIDVHVEALSFFMRQIKN